MRSFHFALWNNVRLIEDKFLGKNPIINKFFNIVKWWVCFKITSSRNWNSIPHEISAKSTGKVVVSFYTWCLSNIKGEESGTHWWGNTSESLIPAAAALGSFQGPCLIAQWKDSHTWKWKLMFAQPFWQANREAEIFLPLPTHYLWW